MRHLKSVTEEIQFNANISEDSKKYILLRKLYEYIAQFRAYAMFQFRDHWLDGSEVDGERELVSTIYVIHNVRLDIDGEIVETALFDEIDKIIVFAAGLEHAGQVKWSAKYSYFNDSSEMNIIDGYKPAYMYFDEVSLYGSSISELLGLNTIIQVRDEDNGGERFSYYFSPVGKKELFYGTQTSGDIKDVANISAWHGDFESMGIVLPFTITPQKRQLIGKVFGELCDHYGATDLSDYMVEYSKQIIYGDCWNGAHLTAQQLPDFIRDLKALNRLVIESDPNAKLMLDGYLLPDDPNYPSCVIQLNYDDERQIQLKTIYLPA